MSSFISRIFNKATLEYRLLTGLLPVVLVLIFVDNFLDQLTWKEDQSWAILSVIKFAVSLPIIALVIYILSKIIDKRLTETRTALQKSEELFYAIFKNNSSAILLIETDSTISMVNEAYCQMTGYSLEEVKGRSWADFVPASELERLTDYNRHRIQQTAEVPSNYEFRFNKKNGEVRVGLMSVFYDKLLNQIVTSITDITERKEMEDILQESREKYKKLIELQGEGLGIVDKEERFIFTNPAAERIMGVPEGTLLGRKLDEFVSHSTLGQIQKESGLRASGQQSTYEMEIVRKDGDKRILLVTATPTFNKSGDFESSLGIFLDITERKKIENALIKNEAELKALNTTKDKLFSIIAHDLRGPVGTSADLLEVMIESFESFNKEEQLKMLDILKNSAKSTYNLLETLLNWSIIQTENLVFKPELFNLSRCIDSIVQNMVPTAFSKNITLLYEPGEDIFTYADQNMVQTVFRNLIGNAIKYTFRGGSIVIKALNLGNKIEVSVSDNGVGMDEETRKNLFVLIKQNSKYGTENEKGTGLGLILCKEFIEKHSGHIRVESELGKGTSFIFDIPKVQTNHENSPQKGQLEHEGQKKFNEEQILIVEDDEINFQVLRSILMSVNLKCDRAVDGKKAVEMFLNNKYSLILMDVQLPQMNGWEATMKIRENNAEIPIIAVTAYASDPTRKKSMEAGCNDFVTKPINKIRLIQVIDKYLHKNNMSLVNYK